MTKFIPMKRIAEEMDVNTIRNDLRREFKMTEVSRWLMELWS